MALLKDADVRGDGDRGLQVVALERRASVVRVFGGSALWGACWRCGTAGLKSGTRVVRKIAPNWAPCARTSMRIGACPATSYEEAGFEGPEPMWPGSVRPGPKPASSPNSLPEARSSSKAKPSAPISGKRPPLKPVMHGPLKSTSCKNARRRPAARILRLRVHGHFDCACVLSRARTRRLWRTPSARRPHKPNVAPPQLTLIRMGHIGGHLSGSLPDNALQSGRLVGRV